MKIFERKKYLQKIQKELNDSETILFLIWARQVGKTTLLKSLLEFGYIKKEQTLWIDGDYLMDLKVNSFVELWNYLNANYDVQKAKYLIIDEAQLVPWIGDILLVLVNKIRRWEINLKPIVSGSWSLSIFEWMHDSLVGRKKIIKVYPFDWEEFLEAKGKKNILGLDERRIREYLPLFKEYAKFGGYPKVVLEPTAQQKYLVLKSLVEDYLLKDVLYFLKQDEVLGFREFVKIVAQNIGKVMGISYLEGKMWMKRAKLQKFLLLAQNTFWIEKVEWFVGGRVARETKKFFKLYFVDVGVLNYLLGQGEFDFIKWVIVENFAFNWLVANKPDWRELYFYRSGWGTEIDFVAKDMVHKYIVPIEAKSGNKDTLGKGYIGFLKAYNELIPKWYILTHSLVKQRQEENKIVQFLPYVLIQNIKRDLGWL